MTTVNICHFNKYGHCRYGDICRYFHNNKICDIESCDVESCNLRHPKKCSFWSEYGRYKFGTFCSYKHKSQSSSFLTSEKQETVEKLILEKEEEIEALKKGLKEVQAIVKNIVYEQKEKDERLEELEEVIEKLTDPFDPMTVGCVRMPVMETQILETADGFPEHVDIISRVYPAWSLKSP